MSLNLLRPRPERLQQHPDEAAAVDGEVRERDQRRESSRRMHGARCTFRVRRAQSKSG